MNFTESIHVELNLKALLANLRQVRRLAPASKVLAVVKADGYGHGLTRVAGALREADGFAVARIEEGIALRRAGIGHPIVVLQGFQDKEAWNALCHYRLEPVVHEFSQIEMAARQPALRPWIKFDSGMHRLGMEENEFVAAVERLIPLKPVLMSHFACADEESSVTADQLSAFERVTQGFGLPRSCANSAAVLSCPKSHFDWVRPGLMLYGISPFPGITGPALGLQPVMTLKSRVITAKNLAEGESVGYGGTWTSQRPTRLGVVAAGYGDGYPREVPSGTPVLVEGKRVPLVGRVSMDMISVDLTDHPELQAGAEVVLWGAGLPVEEIARYAGTLPYTLICGITARVAKVEMGGGEIHGARQGCL
ncbi:MAG: hypothetical protein AXA67_10720 [Methylothermaceae bacteria B42]|nr:MAG: hypothetical protein AXA67_10720 [Methylothermaceae bacteria B42]HHJ38949.1 alanine racemase [Methylothermaceae bacterium]